LVLAAYVLALAFALALACVCVCVCTTPLWGRAIAKYSRYSSSSQVLEVGAHWCSTCDHREQHGTARHSTAQYSTAQHGTAQHGTENSTAQHGTVRHSTAQYGTARHGTEYRESLTHPCTRCTPGLHACMQRHSVKGYTTPYTILYLIYPFAPLSCMRVCNDTVRQSGCGAHGAIGQPGAEGTPPSIAAVHP
jgi:hypothetical protein